MKPYISFINGKAIWSYFWGDKIKKKNRKTFKKTKRQESKKLIIRQSAAEPIN